jgi:hypothetical protein
MSLTFNRLCIYEILSLKPRLVLSISQLEHSPLCVTYTYEEDDDTDVILFGDDGGYVNVLHLKKKFFENMTDNSLLEQLTPVILTKKKSDPKNSLANITFFRRKIHNDWMLKILYVAEINAFVSCSLESEKSLVIGDLDRKTVRSVSIPKGVKCFEFCRRPRFLNAGI